MHAFTECTLIGPFVGVSVAYGVSVGDGLVGESASVSVFGTASYALRGFAVSVSLTDTGASVNFERAVGFMLGAGIKFCKTDCIKR